MGDVFIAKYGKLTDTSTAYYVVNSTSSATVLSIFTCMGPLSIGSEVTVQVQSVDGTFYLSKNVQVPDVGSLQHVSGQLRLSGSDKIYAYMSRSSVLTCSIIISAVEHNVAPMS